MAGACTGDARAPVPRPAGENADDIPGIPVTFHGRWGVDAEACRNPDASIEGITITADELRFHESIGTPTRMVEEGDDRVRLSVDYEGEGQQWTSRQSLQRNGDRLTLRGPDDVELHRVKCAPSDIAGGH